MLKQIKTWFLRRLCIRKHSPTPHARKEHMLSNMKALYGVWMVTLMSQGAVGEMYNTLEGWDSLQFQSMNF